MDWNTEKRWYRCNSRGSARNSGPPAVAAEPTAPENLASRGGSAHNASPLATAVPTATGNQAAAAVGPGTLVPPAIQFWLPAHPTCSSGAHKSYNRGHGRGACVLLAGLLPMQLRGCCPWWKSPPSQCSRQQHHWHWQLQGTNDPGGTRSNNEGKGWHLWQRQWRVENADFQIYPKAAQVRETKDLCYVATYWTTKERPLISDLLNS